MLKVKVKIVKTLSMFFFGICPPPGLLPVLGLCEHYMTPTLDAALLISSRAVTMKIWDSVYIS